MPLSTMATTAFRPRKPASAVRSAPICLRFHCSPAFGSLLTPAAVAGLSHPTGSSGVLYNPLADRWQLTSDTDVNYMVAAARA